MLEGKDQIGQGLAEIASGQGAQIHERIEWKLYAFLSDGRVPMDNNLAERVVKPFAIDRKNFLFSKAETGAEESVTMMTAIRTALRNGLIPERCLAWLFENSSKLPVARPHALVRRRAGFLQGAGQLTNFGVISDTASEMSDKNIRCLLYRESFMDTYLGGFYLAHPKIDHTKTKKRQLCHTHPSK